MNIIKITYSNFALIKAALCLDNSILFGYKHETSIFGIIELSKIINQLEVHAMNNITKITKLIITGWNVRYYIDLGFSSAYASILRYNIR